MEKSATNWGFMIFLGNAQREAAGSYPVVLFQKGNKYIAHK